MTTTSSRVIIIGGDYNPHSYIPPSQRFEKSSLVELVFLIHNNVEKSFLTTTDIMSIIDTMS